MVRRVKGRFPFVRTGRPDHCPTSQFHNEIGFFPGSSASCINFRIWLILLESFDLKYNIIDSPGDIHFRIHDDVTDNCVLDLQRKISIRNAFAPLSFWLLSFMPRDHTLLVLRNTRVNLLVVYSNKIYMHESLVHMHSLWKYVCVISAPLLVHCVNVSWIVR